MTDEKFTDLAIKITSELSSLNTNMRNVLEKLTNHEVRLLELERVKQVGSVQNGCLKDRVIEWLVKGILIALGVIATSAGCGGVIKSVFGM